MSDPLRESVNGKDDWSLRGLKSKKVDRVDFSFDVPFWFYHETTIDTLHKKLIEDVEHELFPQLTEKGAWWNSALKICIDIINKRFGVDK